MSLIQRPPITRAELAHELNVLFWRRADVHAAIKAEEKSFSPQYVEARKHYTRQFGRVCELLGVQGTDAELDNI